jgi:hypothetical protein
MTNEQRTMTNEQRTRCRSSQADWCGGREFGRAIQSLARRGGLAFFVLFYLYLWLYVDLRLIYYSAGMITEFPVFFRGWVFFRQFTSYPGGPAEYVAAFLAQFFYYSWSAALVVTLQAWLICLCTGYFLKAINASSLHLLRFIVPILLLVICSQYTYHFAATTTISAALLFVCLYLRLTPPHNPAVTQEQHGDDNPPACRLCAIALFFILSAILYYIAGGAYPLFAGLCAVRELLARRPRLAGLYLLSAVAIPYIEGVLIFGVSINKAFTESLPSSWKIDLFKARTTPVTATYALYVIVCVGVFALGLWRLFAGRARPPEKAAKPKPAKKQKGKTSHKSFNPFAAVLSRHARRRLGGQARSGAFKWFVESLIMFGIAGAAAFFSNNSERRMMLEIHYYTCRRMWPQVLQAAGHRSTSYFAINAVNRALYHTGRLGSEMFAYPQHPDALLLTGEDRVLVYWHKFDTQLDLGLVNMAQKDFTECMEVYGEHPLILKRLALINMVKGNIGAAKIYLGALGKTLFDADWARDYLARLQSDPNLSTDANIQQLRSVRLKKDHPTVVFANEKMFLTLLSENSKNRMAFEYLMSWYLLTKQLDKLVGNIGRLKELGYSAIPRHYEEALLINAYGKNEPVFLHGYEAGPEASRQIESFSKIFNSYGGNKQAAIHKLAEDYGGSYFFYHLYGFSGVKK